MKRILPLPPRSNRLPALLALLATVSPPLHAQQTHVVGDAAYADFAAGERERLSLSVRGKLETSPGLEKLTDLEAGVLWAAVPDGEGGLWISAGGEVSLLHMDAEGATEEIFTSGAVLGNGLAADEEGSVYLGTSPDGRIYRLPAGAEKPEAFARLPVDYIWNLAWEEGRLWATTGLPAALYRIDPASGEAVEIFTAREDHFQSHLFADGAHFLGGNPSGSVYRVEADGSARSLLSLPESEVRGLAVDEAGLLWILGYQDKGGSGMQGSDESPEEAFQRMMREAQGGGKEARKETGGPSARTRLYRQNKDGFVLPTWEVPEAGGSSLAIFGGGVKLVGAESGGALYAVSNRNRWSRVVDLPAGGDVLRIVPDPAREGSVFILSSQPASVHRLGGPATEKGVFTSRVHDATQPVNWGTVELLVEGAPELTVETRSGNSPAPDATWSDWKALEGALGGGFYRADAGIRASRFLQYRITLTETAPGDALRRSRLFVQLPNEVPVVSKVISLPYAVEARRTPANGRGFGYEALFREEDLAKLESEGGERLQFLRKTGGGQRTFFWRAQDPNGDPLVFDLYLHDRQSDRRLLIGRDHEDPFWTLSTDGFEEGVYQLEVVARDHWDREGEGTPGHGFSEDFLIDHLAPGIGEVTVEPEGADGGVIRFVVEDGFSVIEAVEIGFAGGPLRPVVPEDGLYDRLRETFRVPLPDGVDPDGANPRIRAVDESGNEALRVP